MARFCICGCGKELKDEDGNTDYSRGRVFFSGACRNKDKAQRMRDKRKLLKLKPRYCSKCGELIEQEKTNQNNA